MPAFEQDYDLIWFTIDGRGGTCGICTGDVNGDGSIDALDIEPFLNCLFP